MRKEFWASRLNPLRLLSDKQLDWLLSFLVWVLAGAPIERPDRYSVLLNRKVPGTRGSIKRAFGGWNRK